MIKLPPLQTSTLRGMTMAEEAKTTATRTTRPSRARSTTATKTAAAAKKAPIKAEALAVAIDEPMKVELEYASDTARYARFNMPESLAGVAVGSIYAPHGTSKVLVLLVPEQPEEAKA
jgi:hypothetical protein